MAMVAAAIAMVVGSLFLAGPVSAQAVESGSFSFISDPGDDIGDGHSYSYNTNAGDEMTVTGYDEQTIETVIDGTDGNDWHFSISGPAGETLAPGTYTITMAETTPGISLWRPEVFCWGIGSFTINKIEWGPSSYIHALDATFEYHCWGHPPATRGQLHILNPPPPPSLKLGLTVAGGGKVSEADGSAKLHGTVKCNKAANVGIDGTIVQARKGQRVEGEFTQEFACTPGARIPWTATVAPPEGMTFHKGHARTKSRVSGLDNDYDTVTTVKNARVVSLTAQKT